MFAPYKSSIGFALHPEGSGATLSGALLPAPSAPRVKRLWGEFESRAREWSGPQAPRSARPQRAVSKSTAASRRFDGAVRRPCELPAQLENPFGRSPGARVETRAEAALALLGDRVTVPDFGGARIYLLYCPQKTRFSLVLTIFPAIK